MEAALKSPEFAKKLIGFLLAELQGKRAEEKLPEQNRSPPLVWKKRKKESGQEWFDAPKRNLYVLRCEKEKFYVGTTDKDPTERFIEHLHGNLDATGQSPLRTASWTTEYPPIEILDARPCTSWHDEENVTLDFMAQYGIENVRGGTFSQLNLPNTSIVYIKARLASMKGTCFLCGFAGHMAKQCTNKSSSFIADSK